VVLTRLASYANPARTAPSAPVLLVQGTDDEAVPYFLTADVLLGQLQAYKSPTVEFVSVSGANHDGAVFSTTTQVADWIATRFA
jgi:alpha-beta hydrolase superfamily lysophospholipase